MIEKYTSKFKEMTYGNLKTVGDLRQLLFDIKFQEITVRELRSKLFDLKDDMSLDSRVLNRI